MESKDIIFVLVSFPEGRNELFHASFIFNLRKVEAGIILLLASHEMSPEKIAYQKLQALSYGHNISAEGGINRNYFSLKKSTAQYKTLCVSTNVMPILVPATFDMQFSQGSSRDSPAVYTKVIFDLMGLLVISRLG
jgi:hypothetical protein